MIRAPLRPSPLTALVLVVSVPPALEALRLRSIADAAHGVPAHITLLFPFADADPAWSELPVKFTARSVDLIGRRADRWPTWRRFPLSGAGTP